MVNQQCLVYKFERDLCDAGYVGLIHTPSSTRQRIEEHKNSSSSISKHFRDKLSLSPEDLTRNFSFLKKCTNKFDCLVYEMFNELRPTLNVQSDLIHDFVISFLKFTSFFLCMFLLSAYVCKNFYTFYVHIYFFVLLFYYSLESDRSTVETLCLPLIFIVKCCKKPLLIGNEFDD